MEITVEGLPLDVYIKQTIAKEVKKLKPPEYEGFVDIRVFCDRACRSRPVILRLLYANREKLAIENGGWVHYPNFEDNKWAFQYQKMMDFINGPLYTKYLGGEK